MMKLYDTCLLYFAKQTMEIDSLPERIRQDIDVLRTLYQAMPTLKETRLISIVSKPIKVVVVNVVSVTVVFVKKNMSKDFLIHRQSMSRKL